MNFSGLSLQTRRFFHCGTKMSYIGTYPLFSVKNVSIRNKAKHKTNVETATLNPHTRVSNNILEDNVSTGSIRHKRDIKKEISV